MKLVEVLAAKLAIAEEGIKVAVESGLQAVIVEAANAHLAVAKEISAASLSAELGFE